MAAEFHATAGEAQAMISLYVLGLAIGHLVYGPVADSFGRRPVMLVGLAAYTVASLASALVTALDALVVTRMLQALGGCAAMVLARTIVRDTSGNSDAIRRLAQMNLMVTIAPVLGPIVGGFIAPSAGWRAISLLLAAFGSAALVLAWRLLPETRDAATQLSAVELRRHYGRLVRSRIFIALALGGGCATTSMYAFIVAAPFVFVNQLHRPIQEVGVYLAVLISGVWLGNAFTSRLAGKVPADWLLVRANALSLAAALVLLAASLAGELSVPGVVASMFALTVGVGMAAPLALTRAISIHPEVTGSAAGLYGAIQMAVGSVSMMLAGLGQDAAIAASLVLVGAGLMSQLAFWLTLRRPLR